MKRTLAAIVALGALAACNQTIQHDLEEAQANEIESLLTEAGIDARKERGGGRTPKWAIAVPADRTTAAIKLLNDHGLPRKQAPGFAEVFGKGSMVPTATEESALFVLALSGELSRTLTGLEGVVDARVHIVAAPAVPQTGARPPPRSSAAVLLKARNGQASSLEQRREEIQALVAGSVAELVPGDVAVMISEVPPAPSLVTPPGSRLSARLPLLVALVLVALLSMALALVLVRTRRLRLLLSGKETAESSSPTDSSAVRPAVAAAQKAA